MADGGHGGRLSMNGSHNECSKLWLMTVTKDDDHDKQWSSS